MYHFCFLTLTHCHLFVFFFLLVVQACMYRSFYLPCRVLHLPYLRFWVCRWFEFTDCVLLFSLLNISYFVYVYLLYIWLCESCCIHLYVAHVFAFAVRSSWRLEYLIENFLCDLNFWNDKCFFFFLYTVIVFAWSCCVCLCATHTRCPLICVCREFALVSLLFLLLWDC